MKIRKRSKAKPEKKKKKGKKKKKKELFFEFLSTGCILLNLALSGLGINGGIARGRIFNVIGDGSTGKTLLCLEIAAQCYYNLTKITSKIFGKVKEVIIVYNNVEGVMDFPIKEMFGPDFAEAIQWERISIVERIARKIVKRVRELKDNQALIYIIDSWDGVKSLEETKRFDKDMGKADDAEMESAGYGRSKQAYTHEFFRNLTDKIYGADYATGDYDYQLAQKDVTILITSQIREKMNATNFEKKFYRTGGKAFDFWTHACLWLYYAGRLTNTRKGKKVTYGIKVRGVVERNKVCPPWKEANFPIIHTNNHGIDNVGSMVDYVEGPQKKSYAWKGQPIGQKEKFIQWIQDNNKEKELIKMTVAEWNHIEESAGVKRKPKFR